MSHLGTAASERTWTWIWQLPGWFTAQGSGDEDSQKAAAANPINPEHMQGVVPALTNTLGTEVT